MLVTQHRVNTPKPVWNPDTPQTIDFFDGWDEVPDNSPTTTASRCSGRCSCAMSPRMRPGAMDLVEGAKGVQLAELGLKSWAERRWLDVPALEV